MSEDKFFILDLGSGTAKMGFDNSNQPTVMDNCIMKTKNNSTRGYIGNEIDDCQHPTGLFSYLPFKKGYIDNWDLQKQILDYFIDVSFKKSVVESQRRPENFNIVVTQPIFNFSSIKETMNEVFFESYQFNGMICESGPFFVDYKHNWQRRLAPPHTHTHTNKNNNKCGGDDTFSLVIDSGHSFTHFVPFRNGRQINAATKRMTIGGKILTNRLTEIVSYRQLDVRSESFIMRQCKEDVGFVSAGFRRDLERVRLEQQMSRAAAARKRKTATPTATTKADENTKETATTTEQSDQQQDGICVDYVLPDYVKHRRGFIRRAGVAQAALNGATPSTITTMSSTNSITCVGDAASLGGGEYPVESTNNNNNNNPGEYVLKLGNERIAVPELLFHPSDVGFNEMGISEASAHILNNIMQSDAKCRYYCGENVILCGGNARFPGIRERLISDLRAEIPEDFALNVYMDDDPMLSAWHGAKQLAVNIRDKVESPEKYLVTRKMYEEFGHSAFDHL